jgi:hypothetical protein
MYHPILRPGAQRKIKKVGDADIVIGLPTYKNLELAVHVAKTALAGVQHFYPQLRSVLINADAGYDAAVRRAVTAEESNSNGTIISGRYDGHLGHGSAVAAILDAALALDARAIIILDSQTQTITPHWIAGLAHLVLENKADLVMARYRWHWADSTINDLLLYPLFRALWGQSLRHPAAPDFALGPTLAAALLDKDVWETEVAAWGLPPWLSTYALLNGYRVAQSALGEKRGLNPPHQLDRREVRRREAQFIGQFQHLMSVMLRLVQLYRPAWANTETFDSLSTLTQFATPAPNGIMIPNPNLEQELTPLLDKLALGWMEHRTLWQDILTADNLAWLEALAALPPDRFYFPGDLWAQIIYDFAVVFNKGEGDPFQVVNSLLPIFYGRLAAFWQEVAGLSIVGYEGTVAAQAVEFEENRSYLTKRWQAYQPV